MAEPNEARLDVVKVIDINSRAADEFVEPLPSGSEPDKYGITAFDPLRAYLKEIGQYRLLTREEEQATAVRCRQFNDKEARNLLVVSNLRLVVKIAFEYYNPNVILLDLIQEGNLGLMHAPDKFNPDRGIRFSTYASFWIRAHILKYIMDRWSAVKVGTTQGQRKLFYRLKKEKRQLEGLGIDPTADVIAQRLNVKAEEVVEMEKRLAHGDLSLDNLRYNEGEETLLDTLASDDDTEAIVLAKNERDRGVDLINQFRGRLPTRELFIFNGRICCEEPLTLEAIAVRLDISRERVRQIESRMMGKFKAFIKQRGEKMAKARAKLDGVTPEEIESVTRPDSQMRDVAMLYHGLKEGKGKLTAEETAKELNKPKDSVYAAISVVNKKIQELRSVRASELARGGGANQDYNRSKKPQGAKWRQMRRFVSPWSGLARSSRLSCRAARSTTCLSDFWACNCQNTGQRIKRLFQGVRFFRPLVFICARFVWFLWAELQGVSHFFACLSGVSADIAARSSFVFEHYLPKSNLSAILNLYKTNRYWTEYADTKTKAHQEPKKQKALSSGA